MIQSQPQAAPSPKVPVRGDFAVRLTGEITTKGRRARLRFQRQLADNIRDAVESEGGTARLQREWSRLYVRTSVDSAAALSRVFGISSFSEIEAECSADLEQIVDVGRATYAERVVGKRFAVRARRAGQHPFNSHDVMRDLGAALGAEATVDLSHPEVEVHVEVRDERAHFFSRRERGAGGLPLGAEARAVCLLSGGFDSAAAAWMMLRRGVALDYVFCNLGGEAYQRMVLEVADVLASRWSYGTRPTLFSLDFEPVVTELRRAFRPSFQQIALKRAMYRAGADFASRLGADAVITGEAVGQVSSQTLANLRAIDDASDLPVLRPLVGMDKEEIISLSRVIGTHELSARVREYCSISTGRPATAAAPDAVLGDEDRLDHQVLADTIAAARLFDLRGLDLSMLAGESVFRQDVPEDAIVVDTRPPEAYHNWHWPGAVHREYQELRAAYRELDREATYVLYCEVGLKSARIAELMQSAGYEAYGFLGGLKALRGLAQRSAAADTGQREQP